MKRICLSFCVVVVFVFSFAHTSYAQSKNTITLSPAYIDVTLEKSQEEAQVSFFITNNTRKPLSLDLFSIDFQQKDDLGTIGFLGKDADNYSYALSSFLQFENPYITVEPGEKEEVKVTIQNRQDLTPGSHYAAVVAREAILEADKPSVAPAISGLIYITKIGGERYNLSFKDLSFPRSVVSVDNPSTAFVTLQNDGNTYLIPYGTADVHDIFGRKIYKGIINESSVRVFPQSIRRVPVYFRSTAFELPLSFNTLRLQARDSLGKTSITYNESYLYVNLWFFGGLIISGVAIIFILKRLKNKKTHD
ncbi:MAG: hypothetical protein KA035_00785 [Candidatus Levybacteria bacterium]|nr:hypothetical protein [Candidatus Levybacteria bacterium]